MSVCQICASLLGKVTHLFLQTLLLLFSNTGVQNGKIWLHSSLALNIFTCAQYSIIWLYCNMFACLFYSVNHWYLQVPTNYAIPHGQWCLRPCDTNLQELWVRIITYIIQGICLLQIVLPKYVCVGRQVALCWKILWMNHPKSLALV